MKTEDLRIEVADIETYRAMFLYCGYDPTTNEKFQYEISFRRNDLDALVKHLCDYKRDFIVTFNGIGFDGQVLQFILDKYKKWYDTPYHKIVDYIADFAQAIIDNRDYDIPPPYKEHYLSFRQIDLFKVLHFDNDARSCSLKWGFEFSLDGDIEELPIDHRKPILNEQEIEDVIAYCWNDVMATYAGYKVCIGDTDHPDYKGKNKIQLRLDLIEEFNLPHIAINWNDVKIGTELNKKSYLELARMNVNQLWDKVKARKTRSSFSFKDCFPSYTKFETKEFKEFIKKVGSTKVDLNNKQEFRFSHAGVQYMFAKGGGHSNDKPRKVNIPVGKMLMDADVGSMYPRLIEKLGIYPAHLGSIWNTAYIANIPRRMDAKKRYKMTKEPKWDNMQECFKLVLNGNFGKLGDRHDWQYDPFAAMRVTIGGQIDIFMLAEDFVMAGFEIISMNTDGLTILLDASRVQEYYAICKAWEKEVGNDVRGNLEYVEYSLFAQTSVNDYIAIKHADWRQDEDGVFKAFIIDKPVSHKDKVKKKGDFLTSYELHKNKSKTVVSIALEKFFTMGIPVQDTVEEHRNIYDFCIGRKASKDYHYKSIDRKTGKQTDLNKLVRYYCAISTDEKKKKSIPMIAEVDMLKMVKESGFEKLDNGKWFHEDWGEDGSGYAHDAGLSLIDAYIYLLPEELTPGKLYKIKNENSDKTGPARSNCESDSEHQVLFNRPFTVEKWVDFGVDCSYYVRQTNKILDKILPEYKRDRIILEKRQLQLF